MTSGRYGLVLREVGRLLAGGTVASLGTGQLLERFAAHRDEAAFEALVNQHGPMVLGTCRRMLVDPHDVDDAFQATFLVLARRASSIHDADRLGPWLHGVARRVATRSRALSARRNSRERNGDIEQVVEFPDALEGLELRAAIDEELSRLPEKYRAPLVLCYLEGLTHDEAAQQLRWPVGTVRSRLAGGRDRLRSRLTKRGLAPSAAVPAIFPHISIPQALLSTTVRVATSTGSVPAHVATLAKGALIAMMWNKLKLIAVVGLMAGLTAGGAGVAAQQGGMGKGVVANPVTPIDQPIGRNLDEREPLEKELANAKERLKVLQFAWEESDRRWKSLASQGDLDIEPKPSTNRIAKVIEQRTILKTDLDEASRKVEELQYLLRRLESSKAWGPTVRELAETLSARAGNLERDLLVANQRIKQLEKQVADQRAMIELQQDRWERVRDQQSEARSKGAEIAPGTRGEQGGMVAIPRDTIEPKVEAAPVGKVDGAPDQALTWTMNLSASPPLSAMIARDSSRITMVDPELKKMSTYRLPEGSRPAIITPVPVGNDLFAIGMKGERITQLAVFDRKAWHWSVLDLDEPVTRVVPHACLNDEAINPNVMVGFNWNGPWITKVAAFNPWTRKWTSQDLKESAPGYLNSAVYPEAITCMVGRFFYVYSVPAKKWTTLELKTSFARNGWGMDFGPKDGKIVIPEEDVIHSFDIKTAEWTRINMKKPKAEIATPPGGAATGSDIKPSAIAPAEAWPQPAQPRMMTLSGNPTLFAVISAGLDRVTILDPATQKRESFRLPKAMEDINLIDSGKVIGLILKGPEIARVASYDRESRRWFEHELKEPATEVNTMGGLNLIGLHVKAPEITRLDIFDIGEKMWITQDLREPAKDSVSPVLGNTTATYRIGHFLYIYSARVKKWAVLEISPKAAGVNSQGGLFLDGNGKMIVTDGDLIHLYDAQTGDWTHIDTKDEK